MTEAAWWAKYPEAPKAAAPAAENKWWSNYPVKQDAAGDIGGGIVGGLARGAVNLATAPAAVPHMLAHGAALGAEWLARKAMGLPEPTQQQADAKNRAETEGQLVPSPGVVAGKINALVDQHTYHPTTTAGKYAATAAEFAPSAIAGPGGAVRKLIEAAVPAVASEAAGQATAGTAAEPYARVAAGVLGGGATALGAMYRDAPNRMVADATQGVTPAQFDAAQKLQDYAKFRGVNLTGPEAVQQVTGGATKLADALRVVEGSTVGGAKTAQFFAQRPGQVDKAVKQSLDKIAPASTAPAGIGVRAADAAEKALVAATDARTAAVTPLYNAAGSSKVDPQAMRALLADMDKAIKADKTGVIGNEIKNLRGMMIDNPGSPAVPGTPGQAAVRTPVIDPKTGATIRYDMTPAAPGAPETPAVPMQPVLDITNLNRARKAQRERLDMPLAPGRDPITAEQAHAVGPFMDRLKTMMETADPRFAAANRYYGQITDQKIKPLMAGPVGDIAKYTGTQVTTGTKSATDALFPIAGRTLEGQHAVVADTLQRMGKYDPKVGNDLTRQHLANLYDKARTDLQNGPNQYVGANFRKAAAGTPQQRLNLETALKTIPRGKQAEIPQLFDVLQATGTRKQPGSATEFNRQMNADLAEAPLLAQGAKAAVTGGLSIPSAVMSMQDAGKRVWLGKRTGGLADLFLAPDSVKQIAALAQRDPGSPLVQMFARAALQAPLETRPH